MDLKLPIVAHQTGWHQLVFEFCGDHHARQFYVIRGCNFEFVNDFNECGDTCFYILQPDGKKYEWFQIEGLGLIPSKHICSECQGATEFQVNISPTWDLNNNAELQDLFCCESKCLKDILTCQ